MYHNFPIVYHSRVATKIYVQLYTCQKSKAQPASRKKKKTKQNTHTPCWPAIHFAFLVRLFACLFKCFFILFCMIPGCWLLVAYCCFHFNLFDTLFALYLFVFVFNAHVSGGQKKRWLGQGLSRCKLRL